MNGGSKGRQIAAHSGSIRYRRVAKLFCRAVHSSCLKYRSTFLTLAQRTVAGRIGHVVCRLATRAHIALESVSVWIVAPQRCLARIVLNQPLLVPKQPENSIDHRTPLLPGVPLRVSIALVISPRRYGQEASTAPASALMAVGPPILVRAFSADLKSADSLKSAPDLK